MREYRPPGAEAVNDGTGDGAQDSNKLEYAEAEAGAGHEVKSLRGSDVAFGLKGAANTSDIGGGRDPTVTWKEEGGIGSYVDESGRSGQGSSGPSGKGVDEVTVRGAGGELAAELEDLAEEEEEKDVWLPPSLEMAAKHREESVFGGGKLPLWTNVTRNAADGIPDLPRGACLPAPASFLPRGGTRI